MASGFVAITNKEISQITKQAQFLKYTKKGDEVLKSQDLVSTNFDIKDSNIILFGHFCSDDDDIILANYIILESKYLIFVQS